MEHRDPSLHIRRSDLIRLIAEELKEYIYVIPASRKQEIMEEISDKLMVRAKSLSCSSRSIIASNDKLLKKTEKLKLASRSDAGKFAQALVLMRRKAHHRGVKLIGPGDPEWLTLKDVCKSATEFCNEFGFDLNIGYRTYIEIALTMMNGFHLNKLKALHSPISTRYESLQEIEQDKYPRATQEAHEVFMATISRKAGFSESYTNNPDKYVHFVRAAREARGIGVSIEDYIKAQFAAFDWKSAIPEPSQIHGGKARERVMKYCYENSITTKKETESQPKINFNAIKKARRDSNK